MTPRELKLIIMLLIEEENHARFVHEVWNSKPTDTELEGQLEQERDIGYKSGYADGLLHAIDLLRKFSNDEAS